MIIWLLIIAVRFWLMASGNFFLQYFNSNFPIIIIPLLFGPNLYLYSKYVIQENAKFNPFDTIHYIPFLLFCSIYFFVSKENMHTHWLPFRISFTSIFFLSSIAYTSLVFTKLRIYRKRIKSQQFSYDSVENRLFWLNFIALLYVVTFGIYFCIKFYAIRVNSASSSIEIISSIGLILFSYVVSFFGIRQQNLYQPAVVEDDDSLRDNLSTLLQSMSDYIHTDEKLNGTERNIPENTGIDESHSDSCIEEKCVAEESIHEKNELAEKLKNCMLSQKPYLQADLSLHELANKIDIPKHHLSQLLNAHIRKNFFEYVNEYRVEEFKNRMNDPKYQHLTLVAIAYGCGFNSKSTFNSFFKEYTGYTPSEYKNKMKAEQEKN
jgi:AraC-like DNA-binding protein